MDVDDPDYPNIGVDSFSNQRSNQDDTRFIKQTLLHSPIFTNIIPNFQVHINKRVRGLPSLTVNDEGDQYLLPQEEDSQFDVFSDDDDLFFTIGDTPPARTVKSSSVGPKTSIQLTSIRIVVKTTSMIVNNVEFPFSAPVRSSCVIRGVKNGKDQEEDSLFISLKSGFLFLIRIYYVPRLYKDTDYDIQGQYQLDETYIFKPFIVQWWDTSSDLEIPALDSSGYLLSLHASGLSAVSTSASSVLRIYNCQHTDSGIMFMPHFNVPVDGLILHSCFADPINNSIIDNHVMYLIMTFTEHRRLQLTLYEWSLGESINNNLSKIVLPLDNSFKIPIFVVSLSNNDSFLFITEKELVIVTIHDIISANYGFTRVPYSGSFPTSYYIPHSVISRSDSKSDEVIMSTDNGVIYSIVVTACEIQIRPIVRISDPISVFSIEKVGEEFNLIFGSDTGSSRELIIPRLFTDEYLQELNTWQKPSYSSVHVVADFKNWTPILDVLIIDSYKSRTINNISNQELWALTGIGKRSRLTQLRSGYSAIRRSKVYEQLRKADKLYYITIGKSYYLFCLLPLETVVLEYIPEEEDAFIKIEDAPIVSTSSSLLIAKIIPGQDVLLQITQSSITITNLFESSITSKFQDKKILFCDLSKGLLVIVLQSTLNKNSITLELYKISGKVNFNVNVEECGALELIASLPLSYEPSMVKLIDLSISNYIITGSYGGSLVVYEIDSNSSINMLLETYLNELNPYTKENTINEDFIIPHDSIQGLQTENNFYLGSKEGFFIHLQFKTDFTLKCKNFLRIGDTPVTFQTIENEHRIICILSRNLWLLNLYDSNFPTQVYFDEKHDKAISAIIQLPTGSDNSTFEDDKCFALVREEGLSVCSILPFKKPNIKQINLAESAKKFIYLNYLAVFVVLCNSKDPKSRLKFVDRRALKTLHHNELNSKSKELELDTFIFDSNEIPISACIWSIKRQDRVSKKLLIGCNINDSTGSFKVLDITKLQNSREEPVYIRVTELTSFEHKEPISKILQIDSSILFSSGRSIYSTTYDVDERRLRPISSIISLTSDIVSLSYEGDDKLLVTTKLDSIFQFTYEKNTENDSIKLKLVFKDPSPKSIVNQTVLGSNIIAGDKLHSSVLIMKTNDLCLKNLVSYKMLSIPRVYSSKFNSYWVNLETSEENKYDVNTICNSNVLCVGVSGEITSIRSVSTDSEELDELGRSLNLGNQGDPLESFIEILNRPFIDKVTGKGLSSINKPHFRYRDNKGKLIDYDFDEISKLCKVNVSI